MAISTSKPRPAPPDSSSDSDSDSDDDLSLAQDMEALRKACLLNPSTPSPPAASVPAASTYSISDTDTDTDTDLSDTDDIELARSFHRRFNGDQPLDLKPLRTLPPIGWSDEEDSSDEEDDYETLRAIERRFAGIKSKVVQNTKTVVPDKPEVVQNTKTVVPDEPEVVQNTKTVVPDEPEVVQGSNTAPGHETSSSSPIHRKEASSLDGICHDSDEGFCSSVPLISTFDTDSLDQPFGSNDWHQQEASKSPALPSKFSGFSHPKSVHFLIDAIRKNRAYQKLIRNKLLQIEVKIEENKKLKERVKILKDFQLACKRKAGRSLSQKKDDRIQLISAHKLKSSTSKVNDKRVPIVRLGPVENAQVANYRMVMERFPRSLRRERWSDEERKNLGMGIKQQFQEMLVQKSLECYRELDISSGDSTNIDDVLAFIEDFNISPEDIRKFLPKVDWNKLASLYIPGRSGAECQTRWLNHEDPLINHSQWDKNEDKKLLSILQKRGIHNWIDISIKMKTNRTPYQCLARYQRSLNSKILKQEWTEEDDDQLTAAVEAFGEKDWLLVASNVEGRTNNQCSNRWLKTLSPARQKVGKWNIEEDVRLKVAVMLFGQKNWHKLHQFVPGRTQVQCRERWVNVLDHSIKLGDWTEEEDSRLKEAVVEHNYCWSKVAKAMSHRTDNQCWRRWKFLNPKVVPVLQAARRLKRTALISNFVSREVDRPSLGPSDFLPLPEPEPEPEPSGLLEADKGNNKRKEKKKSRRKPSGLLEADKGNNKRKEKKKSRRKPSSKRKKRKRNEASMGDDVPTEKTTHLRRSKRLNCIKEVLEAVDAEDRPLVSSKKRKRTKSDSKQPLETIDNEKTVRRFKSDSQPTLETVEDEKKPLALFLTKKAIIKLEQRTMNDQPPSQKDHTASVEVNTEKS